MRLTALATAIVFLVNGITCLPSSYDTTSGCNKALPDGVKPDHSVNLTLSSSSGVTPRKYRLHLPKGYDGSNPLPLILSFHGRSQDALYQENLSQFSNSSYGFEGIAVYPEGVPIVVNKASIQQWQGDPDAPASINDVKFTFELIDHLQSTYCIDTSRIYAAGKSNGGGFTGILACDSVASTRIAAFAPVSGAFYLDKDQQPLPCKPGRKAVPIMEFHGYKDTTIKYAGGNNTLGNANTTSIVNYVDDWVKRDGFKVDANETSYLCSGNKKVTKYSWDDVVVHYNYTNLYHDWPSSFANGDTEKALTCVEAEATSLILAWFKKWTL